MNTGELADKLSQWIKMQAEGAKCRGAVFGMSGGIDSAVIAVLAQHALGKNLLGVIMPCFSIPQDEEHALDVAGKFGIETKKVVLDSTFDTLFGGIPNVSVNPAARRLASANLKARLRMSTLYCFANQLGYMVVGSGNRSELAVGYFTKHGDSGVDILPIGNLVKAQVRELAGYLGIPRIIIDKAPSAGLWEGQTDEAEMGFTYDQLDSFILTGKTEDSARKKIERMMAGCGHKKQTPPIPPF